MRKLDTSSPQQVQLLHKYFGHNMEAANFWLAFCVLPHETRQYPQRLAASAWHLADTRSSVSSSDSGTSPARPAGRGGASSTQAAANGGSSPHLGSRHAQAAAGRAAVVGFSGTNDNQLLLPAQVHQAELVEQPQLCATNGYMLDMLLRTASYSTLTVQVSRLGGSGWLHRHVLTDCYFDLPALSWPASCRQQTLQQVSNRIAASLGGLAGCLQLQQHPVRTTQSAGLHCR